VEIAIVVVIVAILAVVAGVGYQRYRAAAHMHEATQMLSSIRSAQMEYKSESGVFANVSQTPASFYPSASPGAFKTGWGAPCANCVTPTSWERLKMRVPGPVIYGYSTTAGVGGMPTNVGVTVNTETSDALSATASKIGPVDPFYIAVAHGDTNGNSIFCTIVGVSGSNELLITNDGE
jgi:type IV pilus assembly protein PilA